MEFPTGTAVRTEPHRRATAKAGGRTADRRQFALMLAVRITLAHFSVSSASSLPKSAGEPGSTVTPKSTKRAVVLGSARAALSSLLSLLTISAGVFLGAPMPYQPLAS